MPTRGLKHRIHYRTATNSGFVQPEEATTRSPRRPPKRQGHENEFRITLEDKLLEKIAMIWTPAKTMKKSPQTNQEQEASQNTDFTIDSQQQRDYGVPEHRIQYSSLVKT